MARSRISTPSSSCLALQHVEAGRSVALSPSLTLDPRYEVVARPLREAVPRRIVAAVRRPHGRHPVISAVLDQLRAGS